jgi:hypothetical protein
MLHKNKSTILSTIVFFLLMAMPHAKAQETALKPKKERGVFYFAWGYNRDYFSRSSIHFKNNGDDNYDFTLHQVRATDKPNYSKILSKDFSIPQYSYRIGYYFSKNKKRGIEINFDHAKYVMVPDQTARVSGQIRGVALDKDTLITDHFVHFEHTNGANFLMINYLYRFPVWASANGKHAFGVVTKSGAGIVIPKTDVTLFDTRVDNVFHIAGYIVGEELAMRFDFCKHGFTELSAKGAFANYTNSLAVGTGRANHYFFSGEFIFTVGFQL